MNDQIVSRQLISEQADAAAQRSVFNRKLEENPYTPGTEAAAQWRASFCRWLLAHSAPDTDVEGSA